VLEQFGGKKTRHDATSGYYGPVLPLCDITHQPRPLLNVPGALTPQRFVTAQRALRRSFLSKALRQYRGVLKCHAATLTEI
jgi:hypothetical protein